MNSLSLESELMFGAEVFLDPSVKPPTLIEFLEQKGLSLLASKCNFDSNGTIFESFAMLQEIGCNGICSDNDAKLCRKVHTVLQYLHGVKEVLDKYCMLDKNDQESKKRCKQELTAQKILYFQMMKDYVR